MGLSTCALGFVTGALFFVMPQLMASEHLPETKIAAITAAALSANFWYVLFGPILDVRFSRRFYATLITGLAAIFAAIAVLSLHHVVILTVAMVLSAASSTLASAAAGGWFSQIAAVGEKNELSKWMNIALISGDGVMCAVGGELVRDLPAIVAAIALGALIFLPTCVFLFLPAPGADRRLAGESFSQFNHEILALLRRREVVIVLLLFLSPCSSFALTGLLGGLGGDFHASARAVSLAGGIGAFIPGILGCSFFPRIARRLPLRLFYLANGIVGCLFTLSLIAVPLDTWTFTLALFGEFLFQAVAFSIQIGIVFEAIGPDNPLAATTFALLTAATNVPVTYITLIDGHAYSAGGIAGILAMDAGIGIATCLIAGILLAKFDSLGRRRPVSNAALAGGEEQG